jgi:hypothetical protein
MSTLFLTGRDPADGNRSTTEEATMAHATTTMAHDDVHRRKGKPAEYRIYYAIVFAVALPIAAVRRMLPQSEGFLEEGARRGVIGEARALTNTVIPYLFMG